MPQGQGWGEDGLPAYPQPPMPPTRRRRRRRRRGATRWVALATGVGVAVSLAWTARDGDTWPGVTGQHQVAPAVRTPSAVAGRTPDLLQDREAALRQILQRRGEAVTSSDERRWAADVDPDTGRAAVQTELFRRLDLLPWTRWRYQVQDASVALPPGPTASWRASAWAVQVELSYRLSSDRRDVHRTRLMVLRPVNGRWVVAQDLPAGDTRDPWDLGRISVLTSAHAIVVVPAGRRSTGQPYLSDMEAARRKVAEVWSQPWPRVCVVYLPADEKGMAAMLGRPSVAGLDQVAAVTTGELLRGSGTADRIVLNPTAFAGFGRAERRVVLSHELTHVATRATVKLAPPMWLEEGFADYVAYRGSGVTRTQIAQSLLDRVRAGEVPSHLPTAAEFDPREGDIGPAYAGSWLAVDLIARRRGKAALVDYYLRVCGLSSPTGAAAASAAASPDEDVRAAAAFIDVLQQPQEQFVAGWRETVASMAGQG